MEEVVKINAEVVAVLPNKVKIKVDNLDDFKGTEKLKVGSYIQISDNESSDVKLISIIESFLIEVDDKGGRKYLIEANPLGTIEDGKFKRGGDSIALPPKEAVPATIEDIKAIYLSGSEQPGYEKFCFAKLAQNLEIEVPVNGNKFFNKHFAIVGGTGSGKSHTTAKVLQNAIQEKKSGFKGDGLNNSHIVIFDIHSEYATAFPKANKISINDLILPYWLLNGEELEELFLESGDNNNYNQAALLRNIITENKTFNNKSAEKVYFDSPLNFDIDQVLNCLQNLKRETEHGEEENNIQFASGSKQFTSEQEKHNQYFTEVYEFSPPQRANAKEGRHPITRGTYADGSIEKFASRLHTKINTPRLREFLFGEKSKKITFEETLRQFLGYGYNEGKATDGKRENATSNITVIDLSGVPFEVLSITVSLISRLLFDYGYYYKKQNGDNHMPLLLVYEEAHKYVPKNDSAKFRASRLAIERIAKEGRKYGVSLAIISQRPSELSETIFSQCNNFIAMRLTNPEDQNYVKRLLPDTLGAITDILPSLQSGEGLLIGEAVVMPSIVKIDECEHKPSSNDIPYLEKWKNEWYDKVDFAAITKNWSH